MNYSDDKRIVMTLDAGGTNFVFSAIRGNKKIVDEIRMDSKATNLDRSLFNILEGFSKVYSKLDRRPDAISFAFPGPADYENGIIGDLRNLPAFRGGVAVGPMLKEKFNLPVFINNDGDLYAYGEAIAGFLPEVNSWLEKAGSSKRYKNLFGLTLGTGLGSGIVRDEVLYLGDNSVSGELWLVRNKLSPQENVEEFASIRGIQSLYQQKAGLPKDNLPSPKEIFEIAIGKLSGNKEAAVESYAQMAIAVGDSISNIITVLDGLVVIGGGLAGASSLFLPCLIQEMNSYFIKQDGTKFKRLISDVYNLEMEEEKEKFCEEFYTDIPVYGSNKMVKYYSTKKIGVGVSKIGTSNAIAIGAYTFALNKLDSKI
jgi:glucokinase